WARRQTTPAMWKPNRGSRPCRRSTSRRSRCTARSMASYPRRPRRATRAISRSATSAACLTTLATTFRRKRRAHLRRQSWTFLKEGGLIGVQPLHDAAKLCPLHEIAARAPGARSPLGTRLGSVALAHRAHDARSRTRTRGPAFDLLRHHG